MKKKTKRLISFIGGYSIAGFMIASATVAIFSGRINYKNYWGGVVFAPIAIIVGIVFIVLVHREWKGKKVKLKSDEKLFEGPIKDWKKW